MGVLSAVNDVRVSRLELCSFRVLVVKERVETRWEPHPKPEVPSITVLGAVASSPVA